MAQYRLSTLSIETSAQNPESGVSFKEMGAAWTSERGPLSFISGARIAEFCEPYFMPSTAFGPRGVFTVRDATVVADGAVMQGQSLLTGPSLMMDENFFPSVWSSPVFHDARPGSIGVHIPEERVRLPGRTVSLISLGWQVYGHMLIDVLPRIERIIRSGLPVDRFLLGAPKDWHKNLLAITGLPADKFMFLDSNLVAVECEELLLPVLDRLHSEIHPDAMHLYDRLRGAQAPDVAPTRNIFLSRLNWGGARPLANRAEIEQIAAAAGFEIVAPEGLTFAEQFSLFASARSVLGEAGSGMHATLFANPGIKVGVMQSWDHLNFLQSQIAELSGQRIGYALGEHYGDDQWVVATGAARQLAEFLIK